MLTSLIGVCLCWLGGRAPRAFQLAGHVPVSEYDSITGLDESDGSGVTVQRWGRNLHIVSPAGDGWAFVAAGAVRECRVTPDGRYALVDLVPDRNTTQRRLGYAFPSYDVWMANHTPEGLYLYERPGVLAAKLDLTAGDAYPYDTLEGDAYTVRTWSLSPDGHTLTVTAQGPGGDAVLTYTR